jgi:chromosome segregation ATPase
MRAADALRYQITPSAVHPFHTLTSDQQDYWLGQADAVIDQLREEDLIDDDTKRDGTITAMGDEIERLQSQLKECRKQIIELSATINRRNSSLTGEDMRKRAASAARRAYLQDTGSSFDDISSSNQERWCAVADAIILQLQDGGLIGEGRCPDALSKIYKLWNDDSLEHYRRHLASSWPALLEAVDELVNCGDTTSSEITALKAEVELWKRRKNFVDSRVEVLMGKNASLERRIETLVGDNETLVKMAEHESNYYERYRTAVARADRIDDEVKRFQTSNQRLRDDLTAANKRAKHFEQVKESLRKVFDLDRQKWTVEIGKLKRHNEELTSLNKQLQDDKEEWKWSDFTSSSELEKLRKQIAEITDDMACGVADCGCAPKNLLPYFNRLMRIRDPKPGKPVYKKVLNEKSHGHRVGDSVQESALGD